MGSIVVPTMLKVYWRSLRRDARWGAAIESREIGSTRDSPQNFVCAPGDTNLMRELGLIELLRTIHAFERQFVIWLSSEADAGPFIPP